MGKQKHMHCDAQALKDEAAAAEAEALQLKQHREGQLAALGYVVQLNHAKFAQARICTTCQHLTLSLPLSVAPP